MDTYLQIMYWLCFGLNISMALVSFWQKGTKSLATVAFAAFNIFQAAWMASLYFGYYFLHAGLPLLSLICIRLAYGFPLLMHLALIYFSYFFPRPTVAVRHIWHAVFSGITVFFFILAVGTHLIHTQQIFVNGIYANDLFGPLFYVYILWIVVQIMLTFGIGIYKLFTPFSYLERSKFFIALVGCWLFLLAILCVNIIFPMIGIRWVAPQQSVFLALLFILPTFYSIQKYRFFSLTNTSLGLLRKVVILAVFLTVIILSFYALHHVLPMLDLPILVLVVSCAGLAAFYLTHRFFPPLVTSDVADFRRAIKTCAADLYGCSSYEALRLLLDQVFLIRLNIATASVVLVSSARMSPIPVIKGSPLIYALADYRDDIVVASELAASQVTTHGKLLQFLRQHQAEICLPLVHEHQIIGLLFLGDKQGGGLYSSEELEGIKSLQRHLSISLMNIILNSKLTAKIDTLKKIIDRKTVRLQKQNSDFKALAQQQADFISISAHEFRTPITIMWLQLQELCGLSHLDAQVKHGLAETLAVLENMRGLTQSLFDSEQFDLGKATLNLQPTQVYDFLFTIYEDFLPSMSERQLLTEFQCMLPREYTYPMDTIRMRQVVQNILQNAQKYTRSGDRVRLVARSNATNLTICIEDSGPGIPTSQRKTIFGKFHTAAESANSGIGLGLYLARRIIEKHGGTIQAEASDLGGLAVVMRLPIHR